MNRQQLAALARSQSWSSSEIARALEVLELTPTASHWHSFALQMLRGVGSGLLAAGIVCFVAANWSDFGIWGRFALLQLALLASAVLALVRPPPHKLGEFGCFTAAFLIGALFALFGQHYQSGADVHELFFAWAAIALPFAVASRSGVSAALLLVVLNIGLVLFTNVNSSLDFLFGAFWGDGAFQWLLMFSAACNMAVIAALWLLRMRTAWLLALALAAALSYTCIASAWVVENVRLSLSLGFLACFAVAMTISYQLTVRLRSITPAALAAAALIAVSCIVIARILTRSIFDGTSVSLFITLWIAAAATLCGQQLMKLQRGFEANV